MEKRRYADHHEQFDYVLTDKGQDLGVAIMALTAWGDRWDAPNGPPIVFSHHECGGNVELDLRCASCSAHVAITDVLALSGPGSSSGARYSSAKK